MNEQELAEIKERYAKLGDEDANVIHRLLEKIDWLIASLHNRDVSLETYRIEVEQAQVEIARLRTERNEARRALGQAAMEINVAGPVDHRIRVLRKELSDAIDKAQTRCEKYLKIAKELTRQKRVLFEQNERLIDMNIEASGVIRELKVKLADTPEEQAENNESAWLAAMSGTWYDKYQQSITEIEQLKLQLAQANAALGIVDPALGTGAFLAGLENPPYGEKDGE